MLIREYMTQNPVTISSRASVSDALHLMRDKKVRRFPVVDDGKLVGIVSDKDLLYASPSPATTLSMWEIPDLLSRIKVGHVMTTKVITIADDTPLEDAARIMADSKVGGLPVMHGDKLVGIITETDLFKMLLELLGGRRTGVRVTASISDAKGTLAKVATAVLDAGGDVVGLGARELPGSDEWEIMLKVQDVAEDKLVAAMRPVVDEVLDVREIDQVA